MLPAAVSEEFKKAIDAYVEEHKVLAFIKGSTDFPQCGFSNTVVQILKRMEVPFETVDILSNEMLRSGMKEYSQVRSSSKCGWPCPLDRNMWPQGDMPARQCPSAGAVYGCLLVLEEHKVSIQLARNCVSEHVCCSGQPFHRYTLMESSMGVATSC